MTGAVTKESIHSALKEVGLTKIDKEILSKCVALASAQGISIKQMSDCWEAYSLNKNVTELTNHTFESFRTQLCASSGGNNNNVGVIQTRPVKREKPSPMMITPPHSSNKRAKAASSIVDTHNKSSVDAIASKNPTTTSPERVGSSSQTEKKPIVFPTNVANYEERKDAGTVVTTFGNAIKDAAATSGGGGTARRHVTISTQEFEGTNVQKPYRFMFSTIPDRAQALEKHLTSVSENLIEKYGISNEGGGNDAGGSNQITSPLEQVNIPRQDVVCCIGRICNEAHEGKLNKTSVVLEGSSATSGGARINVDLSHIEKSSSNTTTAPGTTTALPPQSYSIFPGQIVAIEGINLTGRKLVAHKIHEGAPSKPNESTVKELRQLSYVNEQQPMKVVTANGPFTTSDKLNYNPLIDLISEFMDDKIPPDVVILTGPFVDGRQELIKTGRVLSEVNEDGEVAVSTFEGFFANRVAALLNELYAEDSSFKTQFILIPSLDDTIAKSVYPQPPLQNNPYNMPMMDLGLADLLRAQEGSSPRVRCLSNPCTFKINEVVFGVTSTDILFHMSTEEIHHNLPPGGRLRRIAQHVLQQRSYYPVFPPPIHGQGTNLDLTHMDQWKVPARPDVLILPSKLKAMATTDLIDGNTVVVNPGCLTRAASGGTYAIMEIQPIRKDLLDNASGDDTAIPHKVNERINVTVKRI